MGGGERSVEVDDDTAVLAHGAVFSGVVPGALAGGGAGETDRGQSPPGLGGQRGDGARDSGIGGHGPVQDGFGPQQRGVGRAVAAQCEGEGQIGADLGGVAESWGMGIDANGQVSTDNNRVPAEGQIRLSQDGNLREVTDRREATMSTTERTPDRVEQLWADWREARRTGDTKAMNDLRAQRRELLGDMVGNAVFEMTKAGANVLGGIGLEGIRWLSSDEEDQEFLQERQIQNGFFQVLTATPKGRLSKFMSGRISLQKQEQAKSHGGTLQSWDTSPCGTHLMMSGANSTKKTNP
ncbi:hypothetical protein GCM10007147_45580 [Nocardiopsis kunsanensis]|uniref:Uncharacterized protein n=2 Tax=Nocardiopsis kunsanensis TaxID=141693 RepID=A0A918XLE3_9ACTN|nr:hypothetical protein GCM10007147_45580 [Nocardiopsis kunsanensis]